MKKVVVTILSAVMLLTVSGCGTPRENLINENTQSTPPTQTPTEKPQPTNTELSFEFIDTSIFDKTYLSDGVYKCGADFDAGDYFILSLYGAEALYDVSDTLDFSWSYHTNERFIHAEEGQFVKLGHALLIPVDDIDTSNPAQYGIFTVGKDLPAGVYKAEAIADSYVNRTYGVNVSKPFASYQIADPTTDNIINANLLFNNQEYIELKDGQIISINNLHLTLSE